MESSTQNKQNVAQLIHDAEGKLQVFFYGWTAFLVQFFKTIPKVTSYHNFKACSTQPGKLRLKEFSSSEEKWQSFLKPGVRMRDIDAMPDRTTVPGLDLRRQWYLYEQIRSHCKSNLAADLTCPKPREPKPTGASCSHSSVEPMNDGPPSPKKRRNCSVCHQPGHTKRSCPAKV